MCCPSLKKKSSTCENTIEKLPRERSIRFKTCSDVKSLDITQLEIFQATLNRQPKDSETGSQAYNSQALSKAKDNENPLRLKYKRKGRSGSTGRIIRQSRSVDIKQTCEL